MNFSFSNLPVGILLIMAGLVLLLLLNKGVIEFLRSITGKPITYIDRISTKIIFSVVGIALILSGIFYTFRFTGEIKSTACIYGNVATTDTDAIPWLINQEAQATVSGNMDLIKDIFTDDAKIVDYTNRNSPTVFNNPIDRYQQLFKDTQFIDDQNRNIKAVAPIVGNTAYYISGSKGSFQYNGQMYSFDNPDDASHWTLTKINGCWKITKFEFNASGIKFP